eukprot:7937360-Pyramimonas_sp.AAC.1
MTGDPSSRALGRFVSSSGSVCSSYPRCAGQACVRPPVHAGEAFWAALSRRCPMGQNCTSVHCEFLTASALPRFGKSW